MKRLALTLGIALASLLATTSFAQTRGEADADQAKALPAKAVTKTEKADAKKVRKTEGMAAVKKTQVGNVEDRPALGQVKVSKQDRKAAAIKRKAEGTEARKDGAGTPDNKP